MGFKIQKARQVENGEYTAVLSDIQPAKGAYGPCLKFFFNIVGGEWDGTEVSMIRPAKLIPGNKLDKTLQSLGIDTSAVEDELDADSLKNKLVEVTVESKTSDRGKVFANVTDTRLSANQTIPTPAPAATVTPTPPANGNAVNSSDVPF